MVTWIHIHTVYLESLVFPRQDVLDLILVVVVVVVVVVVYLVIKTYNNKLN